MEVNETGSVIFLEDTQPLNSALSTGMIFQFSLSDNTFEKKKKKGSNSFGIRSL